jgi:hypothetical protein
MHINETTEFIINWIKEQAYQRNKKSLLVDVSPNNMACGLVAFLCLRSLLKVHTISSVQSSYRLSNKFNIPHHIFSNKEHDMLGDSNDDLNFIGALGLRRAAKQNAYIYSASIEYDALIIGTRCKNDSILIRNYDKFEPVDILPINDLTHTEVYQMYNELVKIEIDDPEPSEFTHAELEWLEQLDKNKGIITADIDPTKHPLWYTYTFIQKALICKAFQIEKLTRHKYNNNIPVCLIDRK